jgi:hypothetical protein
MFFPLTSPLLLSKGLFATGAKKGHAIKIPLQLCCNLETKNIPLRLVVERYLCFPLAMAVEVALNSTDYCLKATNKLINYYAYL